ncbi:iron transporter [Clostridiales bacterium PH28_bin88]|nr:iron transporter [Clostridiales bacterium PH28_bin88]
MTLDKVKRGQWIKILSIPEAEVRAQAIRFGIMEGEVISCAEVVPSGPVILSKNKQEIAIGRKLAERIQVELACAEEWRITRRAQHAVS